MSTAFWEITSESFLAPDEIGLLLALVRRDSGDVSLRYRRAVDRVIIEGLLFSGLRCSEFCGLSVGDTSVSSGRPTLNVRRRGGIDREVWLPSHVDELIREYVARVRPEYARRARDDDQTDPERAASSVAAQSLALADAALVLNDRGRRYDRTALYRRVVRILTAAGLAARASVQLLRHTYAVLAYARTGGNLLFVQRQLGHAHPMITSIYAKFVPESYAALAEAVGAASLRGDTHGAAFTETTP